MKRLWGWLMAAPGRAAAREAQREVGRPITGTYAWAMTSREKRMWHHYGWRVTHWVCPVCGYLRQDTDTGLCLDGGWTVPPKMCDCGGY